MAARLDAQFKGWLTWNGEFLVGPRYIRLLEAIRETGTIRDAAERVGLSYRTCLTRVRRMESVSGRAVVETTRGGTERGSARLTSFGDALIATYQDWRAAVERASREAFARAAAALGRDEAAATPRRARADAPPPASRRPRPGERAAPAPRGRRTP
jgi:molybdate transport system regulatory protein